MHAILNSQENSRPLNSKKKFDDSTRQSDVIDDDKNYEEYEWKNWRNMWMLSITIVTHSSVDIHIHYMTSVHIRSFSGSYSARIQENTDQKNSYYKHF